MEQNERVERPFMVTVKAATPALNNYLKFNKKLLFEISFYSFQLQ